jgi:thiol-disulfide isomerase/thioredoxin
MNKFMKKSILSKISPITFTGFVIVSLIFAIGGWIAIDTDHAMSRSSVESNEFSHFQPNKKPKKLINLSMMDEEKNWQHLSDFRDDVVLLYIWGTWCTKCIHDLQSLDLLQKDFEDQHVTILSLSLDQGEVSLLRKFFDRNVIENLSIYQDPFGRSLVDLDNVRDLPTILLIDKKGNEIGRYYQGVSGDMDGLVDEIKKLM